MDLMQWAIALIAIWLIGGALISAAYYFGFRAGVLEGTSIGLDLAWQRVVTADEDFIDDRRDRLEPQPLAIRYAMSNVGREKPITGRLVLDGMTRADWTRPKAHRVIRQRLMESFPGCEVIGYAVLDRCKEAS